MSRTIKRHPDAAWRKLDGQIVVVAPENGTLHLFNSTAGFLWEQLENERNEHELSQALCSEFETAAETARIDVAEFISEMIEKKVIESV